MSESSKRRLLARAKAKQQMHQLKAGSSAQIDGQELAAAKESYQQVTGKCHAVIELDEAPGPKRPQVPDHLQVVFTAEDENDLAVDPASMDMWLCMKWAITTTKRAKRTYEDGRSKVAEAGKVLQDHANLIKD
ncbi:hypothetical protein L3X38_041496 [Prunus dulcis]|uniref:Uncharacterized protein n=1 Tax=Prunus dulcis TaxID=3755 RepID=A0AAD4YKZ2_PRUDU|nr:hypothetical protein L3X38_041496 [Prunus dulcis]